LRRTCFNPRPHTAGDNMRRRRTGVHPVSIHARTRRATTLARLKLITAFVSIHARTRRATQPQNFLIC